MYQIKLSGFGPGWNLFGSIEGQGTTLGYILTNKCLGTFFFFSLLLLKSKALAPTLEQPRGYLSADMFPFGVYKNKNFEQGQLWLKLNFMTSQYF